MGNNIAKHFPKTRTKQYLIFDRDAKFSAEVDKFLDSAGIAAIRTSYRSSWRNGVAESWVRTFRNDLPDHVIECGPSVAPGTGLSPLISHRLHPRWMTQRHAARRPPSIKNPGERLVLHLRPGGLHHRSS